MPFFGKFFIMNNAQTTLPIFVKKLSKNLKVVIDFVQGIIV